jgi:hypothetical protein
MGWTKPTPIWSCYGSWTIIYTCTFHSCTRGTCFRIHCLPWSLYQFNKQGQIPKKNCYLTTCINSLLQQNQWVCERSWDFKFCIHDGESSSKITILKNLPKKVAPKTLLFKIIIRLWKTLKHNSVKKHWAKLLNNFKASNPCNRLIYSLSRQQWLSQMHILGLACINIYDSEQMKVTMGQNNTNNYPTIYGRQE